MRFSNLSVVWITGLSGAGKTTLGIELVGILKEKGTAPIFLDGDELREVLSLEASNSDFYTREQRLALALRYSKLCKLLSDQGHFVVVATISLFKEIHSWNRRNIRNYYEVFLDIELEVLRDRDSKKIYSRYEDGVITDVAGLDLAVDYPKAPDFVFNNPQHYSVPEMAHKIVSTIGEGKTT